LRFATKEAPAPHGPGARIRVEARAGDSRCAVEHAVGRADCCSPRKHASGLVYPSPVARSCLRPISSVRLPQSARSLSSSRGLTSRDRVGDEGITRVGPAGRLLRHVCDRVLAVNPVAARRAKRSSRRGDCNRRRGEARPFARALHHRQRASWGTAVTHRVRLGKTLVAWIGVGIVAPLHQERQSRRPREDRS
jgi:hypothetical protein